MLQDQCLGTLGFKGIKSAPPHIHLMTLVDDSDEDINILSEFKTEKFFIADYETLSEQYRKLQ